jgi:hypothetical protein
LRARLVFVLGCALAALAALTPAALAAPPPTCSPTQLWARPGIERGYAVSCDHTDTVTLTRAPAHGQLGSFVWDGEWARLRYTPAAGAPDTDSLELVASGPGGSVAATVTFHVIPLSENTAPSCSSLADARRSDGQGPVEFTLYPQCSDAEHDALTVHGGGPGVHLDEPAAIAGGMPWYHVPQWRYRTAALTGTESASYWAVDEFGAKSADAPVSLAFGPGVDRPVECRPEVGGPADVLVRPGATRNFGIACEDADGDAFTARLGSPPQRGTFTTFTPELMPAPPNGGRLTLIDVTYAPASASTEPDPFSVVAETSGGSREFPLRLVPTLDDSPAGGRCGWGSVSTAFGKPADLVVECADPQGDPLQAVITTPPDHGTANPPVIVPGRFGEQQVVIRYTPAAGFTGRDYVGVSVDGGWEMLIRVDVGLPMVPFPPPPTGPGRPAPGQPPARSPAAQARAALGVRAVRLVRKAGVARIYAAKRAVRAVAGRPALAVTCDLACRVEGRLKGRRSGRQRISVKPGHAGVISVPRRVGPGQLAFALTIRADGGAPRRTDVRLSVRR